MAKRKSFVEIPASLADAEIQDKLDSVYEDGLKEGYAEGEYYTIERITFRTLRDEYLTDHAKALIIDALGDTYGLLTGPTPIDSTKAANVLETLYVLGAEDGDQLEEL